MLGQRRRRWATIRSTLVQSILLAGSAVEPMLGYCLRRCLNVKPAMGQRLVTGYT